MLRALAVAVLVSLSFASTALAQDEDREGIRRPERLTVGTADQLLGQLTPDHETLYFVSNRNTTNEIFTQKVDGGGAHRLFDEAAEVTWPRISPHGRSILYVSYADRAQGQLCIRNLPSGEHRRCLDRPNAAALLASYVDEDRVVLVERATIEGNLRVVMIDNLRTLDVKPLMERNLTSPTVSPDGKWMAYVPLERSSDRVGPAFAAHAGQHLEMVALHDLGHPIRIDPDLPGLTAQPAFSTDGQWLYFVQFYGDSNHDGVVDARDHGVVFRVRLTDGRAGMPEQLTDETWNCQYPAPASDRLVLTCSRGKNLDLYTIPLEGEVPAGWDVKRIQAEIDLANSYSRIQLLEYQRLVRATNPIMRRYVMFRLVRLHLRLEELAAAEHQAQHIAALGDEASKAMAAALRTSIAHHRAIRERERGGIVENFYDEARRRMESLAVKPDDTSAPAVLARVIRSEIADSMGDKALARKELEAIPFATGGMARTSRSVMEAYFERADALYRSLDDREALVNVCKKLASIGDLPDDDRLRYARAAVAAMTRGLRYDDAAARLRREAGEGDLAFALELGRLLLLVRDARPGDDVAAQLIALYQREKRADRRRAIMADAVERARRVGAAELVERLAENFVDSAGPEDRRRAERLYTITIIGRAFRRREAKQWAAARADFEAVARRSGSLEAVAGAIDVRLRAHESPAAIARDFERPEVANFARAYLISRELPKLEGDAHEDRAAEAIALLRARWGELKKECMAQALFGAISHEQYLHSGELAAAERAGIHYLVALELVGRNLRYKAMVLGQLGILHTQVGNYRIALGYLEERMGLPYAENTEALAVRLAVARSYLHTGREADAATQADDALTTLDGGGPAFLAKYRPLVLDRAALYNLAAGRFERALELYDQELALPHADPKSLFRFRLARAAAALGAEQPARALPDVEAVDRMLADSRLEAVPEWPRTSKEQVARGYRLITSGLRARALDRLGRLDAAARSLGERKALLASDLSKDDHAQFVRQMMLAEAELADNAIRRGDATTTNAETQRALGHADELHARAQGAIDTDELDVLLFAARTAVDRGQPISADLKKRLERAHADVSKVPVPKLRTYREWLAIYLAFAPSIPPD